MATVTLTNDNGETIEQEVDPSSISFSDDEQPDGYIPQEQMNETIEQRLARKERTVKEQLRSDKEFVSSAAEELGIDTHTEASELKKKAAQADRWKSKAESAEAQVEALRQVQLENEMLGADVELDPAMKDVAKSYVSSQVTYDEDLGYVKKDADGDVAYGDDGRPVTVQDYMNELKDDKPGFFKGSAIDPTDTDTTTRAGGGGGQKVYSKAEYESARDTGSDEEWAKAKKALQDGRVHGLS